MLIDQTLADVRRQRTANVLGVDILLDVWRGSPTGQRAAMHLALGEIHWLGTHGEGWRQLAAGDVPGALEAVRAADSGEPGMDLLGAEALIAAGGIAAGLARLEALHHAGDVPATIALVRRRHLLGDHAGAETAALAVPLHARAALLGARAALANDRLTTAFRFVESFLGGVAPIPDASTAGAMAVVAGTIMARNSRSDQLRRFATGLLEAVNVPDEMMPAVARVAWLGGLAEQAWEHCAGDNPWMVAARLELATLAGDPALAQRLLGEAGAHGMPAAPGVALLRGCVTEEDERTQVERIFNDDAIVHIWRTHPHRWNPWIDAARRAPGTVAVFDLSAGDLPDPAVIPHVVFDDGSLVETLQPRPVELRARRGEGVWIEPPLCGGTGVGRDWPPDETEALRSLPRAPSRERAAIRVLPADEALKEADTGALMVTVAPPGDPFWAGPLPERAWPAMRVVRAGARTGWQGAGDRIVDAVQELTGEAGVQTLE